MLRPAGNREDDVPLPSSTSRRRNPRSGEHSRCVVHPCGGSGAVQSSAAASTGSRRHTPRKHLEQWNVAYPKWRLTEGLTREQKEDGDWRSPGDSFMNRLEVLRATSKAATRAWMDTDLFAFAQAWRAFKDESGLMDFTDLIEAALEKVPVAPGSPMVGFFDEVQDFTPLELKLVRAWGEQMDYILLGGDPQQCIYGFKGASPLAFMNPPLPADHKRILGQTFRYGRAIHAYAEDWIKRLKVREPLSYAPKDEDGAVLHERNLTLDHGYGIVRRVQNLLERHDNVMILASCAYHLSQPHGTLAALRDAGIPFHNPYARHQGQWNPLNPGRGTSTAQRVAAFLSKNGRLWTGRELALWAPLIKANGVFKHGKKQEAALLDSPEPLAYAQLGEYLSAAALEQAPRWDIDWLLEHATPEFKKRLDFPLAIAKQSGTPALTTRPRVVVGTIHSVKGGEAGAVILFPNLSPPGYLEYKKDPDATIRQWYVGITRAKETLVIGGGTNNVVELP
jgi:DNA helicase-2/ATP-dependent DNA helicase PcrA